MKLKGRRQSKNVEVRKPEHTVHQPDVHTVDDDLGGMGPGIPIGKKERQITTGKDSEHLRNKQPLKDQKLTEFDKFANEHYMKPEQRRTDMRTMKDTTKPQRLQETRFFEHDIVDKPFKKDK